MKRRLLPYLFLSLAAAARAEIEPPAIGAIRDSSGSLQAVIGVAGNFVLADAGIFHIVSAGFSGSAGLIKTETELVVLNAKYEIVDRSDTPAGPALFAFDCEGAPALVYYSGTLRGLGPIPATIRFVDDVVSIASSSAKSAAAAVRRGNQLWTLRIALDTGDVLNETLIPDVSGPVLLLPGGGLLFTRDSDLMQRDETGSEKRITAGFQVDAFEWIGKDWIAVREYGSGRIFALHLASGDPRLYQLPEVVR